MKKLSIILQLSLSMLASSAFAEDAVVATYNSGEVKESQIMEELKPQLSNQQSDKSIKKFSDFSCQDQDRLIRIFVNNILLKKEVEKSNILSSKELQAKLENAKMQLAQQELLTNYVKSHVTDKMADEEYNKLVKNLKGKEEIKVGHILVKEEKVAIEVKNKLNKGQSFVKLAETYSIDNASKNSGGVIGYVVLNQPGPLSVVPEIEKEVFALKVNEFSKPIKTNEGWHILTVFEKRPVVVPPKEEAKVYINNNLATEALKQYITDLENKANLKITLPEACNKLEAEK